MDAAAIAKKLAGTNKVSAVPGGITPPDQKRRIVGNTTLLILLMSCAVILSGCNADTQVLGSNHEILDPGIAKPYFLKVNGRQVECWVSRSPAASERGPQGYVLFFVGQGDRTDRYLSDEAHSWDNAVEIWGMNYPGSGGSQGPNQIARVGPDALAVYDAVKQIAGNRPIFVQGASLGTTVALCVAAARPVDGVILVNPPPLRQLIVGEYSWWNLGLISNYIACEVPAELDSIANASRATAPAVVLSAGSDQTVPPKYQRMVIDAYAGPKRIVEMPGRGHEDDLTQEGAEKLAAGKYWLWQSATASSRRNGVSSGGRPPATSAERGMPSANDFLQWSYIPSSRNHNVEEEPGCGADGRLLRFSFFWKPSSAFARTRPSPRYLISR